MLWSDESSFRLFATPGNVKVRRRPGEEWNKDCIVPTVKHGSGSAMVWGCMSSSGVGRLTVCDGTINSEKYQAILRDTCYLQLVRCSGMARTTHSNRIMLHATPQSQQDDGSRPTRFG